MAISSADLNFKPEEWKKDNRLSLVEIDERLTKLRKREHISDLAAEAAVILTPSEQEKGNGNPRFVNHYFFRAGCPQLLADAWDDIFIEIGQIYRFTGHHDWCLQRNGLKHLFQAFFNDNSIDGSFGWISFLTIRRPQVLRSWEDSRLQIVSAAQSERVIELGDRAHLSLAGIPFLPSHFRWVRSASNSPNRFASFHLSKRLEASSFFERGKFFHEFRYSIPDETTSVLEPRIDELPSSQLRHTGLLNLVLLTDASDGSHRMYDNTIEIDPDSGLIHSLRGYTLPLHVGVLVASVVEHSVLSKVLRS